MLKLSGSIKEKAIAVACLIIAAIIALIVYKSAQSTRDVIKVPVLVKDCAEGMQISEAQIQLKEVGKYNLDPRIIKIKSDLIGKYATRDLRVGQYIYNFDISKEKLKKSLVCDVKYGAVSVTTTAVKCIGGVPNSGDYVQALIVKQRPEEKQIDVIAYPELEGIKVLSIQNQSGEDFEKPSTQQKPQGIIPNNSQDKPAIVTFDARPEQVARLLEGEYGGQIHLVMLPLEAQSDTLQEKLYKERIERKAQQQTLQQVTATPPTTGGALHD